MPGKRGPNYPAFGLGEAILKAQKLYEQDGTARTAPDVAIQAWGYTTLNGTSLRVIAALRQYGLLESAEDAIKLSDRALAIILASPDKAKAIHEAANAPAVFGLIKQEFSDGLPSDAAIVSTLVRKYGFQASAAGRCVASFRETIELEKATVDSDIDVRWETSQPPPPRRDAALDRQPERQGATRVMLQWLLADDGVATLTVNKRLAPADIDALKAYLDIVKQQVMLTKTFPPTPQDSPAEP